MSAATPLPVAAIPTTYRGVQFRSRIEARWAATFDGLSWTWAYEPFDLVSYIPDFVLMLDAAPVIVEIKPSVFLADLRGATAKIERSGWTGEYLVLGRGPLPGNWYGPTIGLIGERDSGEWVPADSAESFFCTACAMVSFHSSSGSYRCRGCGADDRKHRGSVGDAVAVAWDAAGNKTQWMGSGAER